MLYNLSNKFEATKFEAKVKTLLASGKEVNLTEPKKVRSISQNSFVHVLFTLYGIEYGLTIEEAKTLVKRECPFMRYEKNGFLFLKKTSYLDVQEMVQFVEWFRNWSAQEGCYLPSSEEYLQEQYYFKKQIDNNRKYL